MTNEAKVGCLRGGIQHALQSSGGLVTALRLRESWMEIQHAVIHHIVRLGVVKVLPHESHHHLVHHTETIAASMIP